MGCLRRRRGRGVRMTGRQSHPDKPALSALRRGRFLFGKSPAAQTFGLAPAFPKKKAPHFRAGLVGWVANGF